MPNVATSQVIKVDDLQTRMMMSYVNLTKSDSTTYPAITTVTIDNTMMLPLTTYYVYDQFALRTSAIP